MWQLDEKFSGSMCFLREWRRTELKTRFSFVKSSLKLAQPKECSQQARWVIFSYHCHTTRLEEINVSCYTRVLSVEFEFGKQPWTEAVWGRDVTGLLVNVRQNVLHYVWGIKSRPFLKMDIFRPATFWSADRASNCNPILFLLRFGEKYKGQGSA